MAESQNIEYKESWRDEYLKWLCGYANAQGGTLFIGIDDDGNVVGVDDSKQLAEALPNKITNALGIIADVDLNTKEGKDFLTITVEKYPSLISYHGRYYYRSGSVLREIAGKELDKALLKVQGITWDAIPLPKITVSDLKPEAIVLFKQKALARGRLTTEDVNVSDKILMENLHLVDDDGFLTRAAMLAFYHDPERWVTGSYIKIGFFGDSHSDLQYQDEVHGPLIEQIDRAIDLVYTKYLKARITYEGIQRVEVFMFPREAFREILLNAVVHKDYAACNSIQISVYDNEMYIWNDGQMPENLRTTESLFAKHSSKPFNPKLAHVFFVSGMIEAWGRGFDKIKSACDALYHTPMPEYDIGAGGIMVRCKANGKYLELMNPNGHDVQKDVQKEDGLEKQIIELISAQRDISLSKMADQLGVSSKTVQRSIDRLKQNGRISRQGGKRFGYWELH